MWLILAAKSRASLLFSPLDTAKPAIQAIPTNVRYRGLPKIAEGHNYAQQLVSHRCQSQHRKSGHTKTCFKSGIKLYIRLGTFCSGLVLYPSPGNTIIFWGDRIFVQLSDWWLFQIKLKTSVPCWQCSTPMFQRERNSRFCFSLLHVQFTSQVWASLKLW